MEKVVPEAEELPKAIVRRIVKSNVSSDINLHKDALIAFGESARIFIHYLAATANDICKENKRQTINADDVFKAIEEIEFPEYIQPLTASLEEFKQKNTLKRSAASKEKDEKKKSKVEEPSQINEKDIRDDIDKNEADENEDEVSEEEKNNEDDENEDDKNEDDENELDNESEDGAHGSD